MEILIHPNHGDRVILADGAPYHWDGAICQYRSGYGAYATTTMIGEWTEATRAQAREIERQI